MTQTLKTFLFDEIVLDESDNKRETLWLDTPVDFMVLACARYRRNDTTDIRAIRAEDIIVQDYEQADSIRDYYEKLFAVKILRGLRLTDWQQGVLEVVTHDNKLSMKDSWNKLLYRLPEYYLNDIRIDNLAINEFKNNPLTEQVSKITDQLTLSHVDTTTRNTKHYKWLVYWFKSQDGVPVKFVVDRNNPLLSCFDMLIKGPVNVHATYVVNRINNLVHYEATQWRLV